MSVEDRERYARDRERIRFRQQGYAVRNRSKNRERERARSGTWRTWQAMKRRCLNSAATNFQYYGGRGITVCKRWESFREFLADMGDRPAGHSIERIDNGKGYEPGNCKWATRSEQMLNRRPLPLKCECGDCRTCKNREYYRKYRAKRRTL